ncbi:MAG: GDSL-type esterase/lipase family protein [Anaerolineales bacterium]|nr:GDSL-type esterase/lipase family protein [Anaerolineales bacterium]
MYKISYRPIFLILISFALALIFVELLTRIVYPVPLVKEYGSNISDQYLPYKPKPLSRITGTAVSQEYEYHYEHNSFGFRDVEHTLRKDKGVFRILGLGDSFTYGVGAEIEQTYLFVLETMLNDVSPERYKVEIVKAGIPRYYPHAQRILLEHYGIHYEPDMIIIGFVPNDVIDTHYGLDAVVLDKSGYLKTRIANDMGELGDFIYKNSHFLRLVLRRITAYRMSQIYNPKWEEVFVENGHHEDDWDAIENEYSKMVEIANSIGANVLIVHIPGQGPWNTNHYYPSERLSIWAKSNNVGFVDVLPAMIVESSREDLYYHIDGHANPLGHEVIAQQIYDYLITTADVQ